MNLLIWQTKVLLSQQLLVCLLSFLLTLKEEAVCSSELLVNFYKIILEDGTLNCSVVSCGKVSIWKHEQEQKCNSHGVGW
jgi:hypothetical protein